MHTKRKKLCEVLVSTAIVSVATVTFYWGFAIIQNWHSQMGAARGAGSLLVGFFGGIVFGLLTMGVYIIPSAFLVSLVMASLKRWSLKGVAAILLAVVFCSSISAYVIDPTQSQTGFGAEGYFMRFDWLLSQFTLEAIILGFVSSLIAFSTVLRCRRRYENAA